jgi:hypothetical protein
VTASISSGWCPKATSAVLRGLQSSAASLQAPKEKPSRTAGGHLRNWRAAFGYPRPRPTWRPPRARAVVGRINAQRAARLQEPPATDAIISLCRRSYHAARANAAAGEQFGRLAAAPGCSPLTLMIHFSGIVGTSSPRRRFAAADFARQHLRGRSEMDRRQLLETLPAGPCTQADAPDRHVKVICSGTGSKNRRCERITPTTPVPFEDQKADTTGTLHAIRGRRLLLGRSIRKTWPKWEQWEDNLLMDHYPIAGSWNPCLRIAAGLALRIAPKSLASANVLDGGARTTTPSCDVLFGKVSDSVLA